ncbi:MAG: hypothetical protein J6W46_07055, partial [Spirochaetaceae bacterium]|nr:hypothetical protein [Spirochaetaceae bacterium]
RTARMASHEAVRVRKSLLSAALAPLCTISKSVNRTKLLFAVNRGLLGVLFAAACSTIEDCSAKSAAFCLHKNRQLMYTSSIIVVQSGVLGEKRTRLRVEVLVSPKKVPTIPIVKLCLDESLNTGQT